MLTDLNGEEAEVPLSLYGYLQHQIEIDIPKVPFIEDINNRESTFQTFQLPVSAFKETNGQLDLTQIKSISLVFKPGETKTILIKDIGIRAVD